MENQFTSEFITGIRKIQQAKQNHKLILFVGAGVSVDSDVPTWSSLIKVMKQEAGVADSEEDFLKIAQMYYNQRGAKEYNDLIRQTLGYKKVVPNQLHHTILELSPEHIITTNYDDLIEQVVEQEAAAYSFVKQDPDLPYAANSNLIIKMHGDLELLNMVLKEDDYINYKHNFPLINSYVSGLFASRLILFIGFSFSDWNLKVILQRVRNILGKDAQPAYLLTDHSYSTIEENYYQKSGVVPLSYTNEIEHYLVRKDKLRTNKALSNKGQLLLNFLTFIKTFEPFEESYGSESVLVQMYESLKRYEELPFLPPHNFSKIFPFAKTYTHYRYKLNTHENENLKKFFNLISIGKAITLPLSKEILEKAGLSQLKQAPQMLEYVIKKFNNSLIQQIDDNKLIYEFPSPCNCPRCCYDRLELAEVFNQATKHITFENSSSVYQKMMDAYINCRIGNFIDSFYFYREAAREAWQAKLYILYFICLSNIKNLAPWIYYESRSDAKEITEQIDKIDLYAVLGKIAIDDFVRKQILYIIENKFFSDISYDIDETIRQIQDTSDFYKDKGVRSGGDAEYAKLQWLIIQFHTYYNRNFIYYEDFEKYKILVTSAFDGLLMAYKLSPEYHYRLKEFQDYFLVLAIQHCDAELLWKVLKRHNFPVLKIAVQASTDAYRSLVSVAINYFKSFHSDFWGPNRKMQAASHNSHFFTSKFCRISANLMTILAISDIDETVFKTIIPHFIEFLEHQSILQALPQGNKSLKFFLDRKFTLFSDEQIEKVLKLSISEKSNLGDLTISLFETIHCRSNYQIKDKEFINNILNKIELGTSDYWKEAVLPLSLIVPLNFKKRCTTFICNLLKKKFNPFLYVNAVENGLIKPSQFYENFLSYSLQVAQELIQYRASADKDRYFFSKFQELDMNKELDLLFYFIGRHQMVLTDHRLVKIAEVSDYYLWLLTSGSFDYSKFNEEWFTKWTTHSFLKHMRGQIKIKELLIKYINDHVSTKDGQTLTQIFLREFVN